MVNPFKWTPNILGAGKEAVKKAKPMSRMGRWFLNRTKLADNYANPNMRYSTKQRIVGGLFSAIESRTLGRMGALGTAVSFKMRGDRQAFKRAVFGNISFAVLGRMGFVGEIISTNIAKKMRVYDNQPDIIEKINAIQRRGKNTPITTSDIVKSLDASAKAIDSKFSLMASIIKEDLMPGYKKMDDRLKKFEKNQEENIYKASAKILEQVRGMSPDMSNLDNLNNSVRDLSGRVNENESNLAAIRKELGFLKTEVTLSRESSNDNAPMFERPNVIPDKNKKEKEESGGIMGAIGGALGWAAKGAGALLAGNAGMAAAGTAVTAGAGYAAWKMFFGEDKANEMQKEADRLKQRMEKYQERYVIDPKTKKPIKLDLTNKKHLELMKNHPNAVINGVQADEYTQQMSKGTQGTPSLTSKGNKDIGIGRLGQTTVFGAAGKNLPNDVFDQYFNNLDVGEVSSSGGFRTGRKSTIGSVMDWMGMGSEGYSASNAKPINLGGDIDPKFGIAESGRYHSLLASERQTRFGEELSDENTIKRLAALGKIEVGSMKPEDKIQWLESYMNQSMFRDKNLSHRLQGKYASYWGGGVGNPNRVSNEEFEEWKKYAQAALAGSNLADLHTDNASNAPGNPLADKRIMQGRQGQWSGGSRNKGEFIYTDAPYEQRRKEWLARLSEKEKGEFMGLSQEQAAKFMAEQNKSESKNLPRAKDGALDISSGKVIQEQMEKAGIRKRPVSEKLENVLQYASAQTGLIPRIWSGGQRGKYERGRGGRTGSTRHDYGNAADLDLEEIDPVTGKRRKLSFRNAEDREKIKQFIYHSARGGATGIGGGQEYMGDGRLHIGFGKTATWNSASKWFNSAFYAGRKDSFDLQKQIAEGKVVLDKSQIEVAEPVKMDNVPMQQRGLAQMSRKLAGVEDPKPVEVAKAEPRQVTGEKGGIITRPKPVKTAESIKPPDTKVNVAQNGAISGGRPSKTKTEDVEAKTTKPDEVAQQGSRGTEKISNPTSYQPESAMPSPGDNGYGEYKNCFI